MIFRRDSWIYHIISISIAYFLSISCNEQPVADPSPIISNNVHITADEPSASSATSPFLAESDIIALIEISAGTLDKWELNKSTDRIEWEQVNGAGRVVNYIGYPGNYGLIPNTILSKERGGDGDPIDVLVLGPPVLRGTRLPCKIIGVLYLVDRGESDHKLIAVYNDSPMYHINDITQLENEYMGITDIIKTWFLNYKGPGKMTSTGFGSREDALALIDNK